MTLSRPESAIERLTALDAIERLSERDASLFTPNAAEQELVADRLGWVSLAEDTADVAEQLRTLRDIAREDGVTTVVLVGMGGSSLATHVLAKTVDGGFAQLLVADTTCPEDLVRLVATLDFAHTLFVIASKSGTTTEVGVIGSILFERAALALGTDEAARRFVAISDPDTALSRHAAQAGWWQVIEARSSVGGRFSALSMFGLVPAALAGIDFELIVERAVRAESDCRTSDTFANPAAQLASFIFDAYQDGRDKLVLIFSEHYRPFGMWLEQLIAESLGKDGRGIVPVVTTRERYGDSIADDHLVVVLRTETDEDLAGYRNVLEQTGPVVRFTIADPHDIGAEFVRWEFAVALLGVLMGVNPFDQPDVEVAKRATRAALAGELPAVDTLPLASLADTARPGDYVAILAYLPTDSHTEAELERLASLIEHALKVPTIVAIGPRYLHSTGQLHKGGPDSGIFLVIGGQEHGAGATGAFAPPQVDVPVPSEPYTLRTLFNAQREGDISSLVLLGRRVFAADSIAQVRAALSR